MAILGNLIKNVGNVIGNSILINLRHYISIKSSNWFHLLSAT